MNDQREPSTISPPTSTSTRTRLPVFEAGEVVVERRVPARARLQLVVEVEHDLAKRRS